MIDRRCLISLVGLILALVDAPAVAQTQSHWIVQLKADVPFGRYVAAYAPDDRLHDGRRFGYLRRGVLGAIMSLERRYGFRADAFFSEAYVGFAASLTAVQQRRLAIDPIVASLEPDNPVVLEPEASAVQAVDWGIYQIGANVSTARSGDGTGTVAGVNVYVIDTGVDASHPDLNVVEHVSMLGEPNTDCYGHGTGVAGIIAAKDNGDFTVGVAPGAPIHGVRVFFCSGFTLPSFVVQGIDWVTAHAIKPAVANMSLGTLINIPAINTAVKNSAASGIVYAVAAGNGNPFKDNEPVDACGTSPASSGRDFLFLNGIITVGATDMADAEAWFSNFGPCVNVWAPGVGVTTTWALSKSADGMFTGSGTSFATPYVAGAAVLLLSRFPTLTPPQVEFLIRLAADVPGTLSRDGATIHRLDVRQF